MRKCILHIGMHKTGTTSLQNSLGDLSDDKFYYARLGKQTNHSVPISTLFAKNPGELRPNLVEGDKAEKLDQYIRDIRVALKQSLADAGDRTLIISGEGLVHLEEDELARMRGFFAKRDFEIEAIAYIRAPGAYASGLFQQVMKNGRRTRLNIARYYPGYGERFAKFDTVFGQDKVRFVKFDRATLYKHDVVLDFCKRIGISEDTVKVVSMNPSASVGLVRLLYQYNNARESFGLVSYDRKASRALDEAVAELEPEKFRFGSKLVAEMVAQNAADMTWIEQRMGESLAEDVDDASPGTVQDEDGLLRPVAGAAAKLAATVQAAGGKLTADKSDNVMFLMDALAKLVPRGTATVAAAVTAAAAQPKHAAAAGQPPAAAAGSEAPAAAVAKPQKPKPRRALTADGRSAPQTLITRTPMPMINKDRKLVVLWSPKSACTTTYVWFSHVSGFSDDVRTYAAWPHKHRMEQYQKSTLYMDSANADPAPWSTLRIIREPYGRAVSIYRHALQTHFADKDMEAYSGGRISAETGYSFQTFLDMVGQLDMRRVDIHFRPQVHPYERDRAPDRVINISKQDLFTELNAFEAEIGLPKTDFNDLNWLHNLESKRKAKQEPMEGDALDQVAFTRHQVVKLGQLPSYSQLLTPEARQKIDVIYKPDFDAYRDYL